MCVISATSYSLLCWLPWARADAAPVNAYKYSPQSECENAFSISTFTILPVKDSPHETKLLSKLKFTILLADVRPVHCISFCRDSLILGFPALERTEDIFLLNPSTSISWVDPTSAWFFFLEITSCKSSNFFSLSFFSWSGIFCANKVAFAFGRSEYVKANSPSYTPVLIKSRFSLKYATVSQGKHEIKTELI